ncbi:MAG: hypothetical protein ABIG95_02405 [Candidatus Woesearchaeota archaeon]
MRNAQSSIEFALLVTFMFLIFTVFFVAVSDRLASIYKEREIILLEELGAYVQNELRLAGSAVDGYYREFEVPLDLNGYDYEIIIQDYAAEGLNQTDLIVHYANHSLDYDHVLPVSKLVTGSIVPKLNTTVVITKTDGVVFVHSG